MLSITVFSDHGFATLGFFYGENPPIAELGHYQKVVLQPSQTTPQQLERLNKLGVTVYAYVSIGEIHKDLPHPGFKPEPYSLGTNTGWNSWIMDLTHTGWQSHLHRHITKIKERGFNGVFLDTMDSYQVSPRQLWTDQQSALIQLINTFKQTGLSILLNRGFEVLDDVGVLADGLVVESLFQEWDPLKKVYQPVPEKTRELLLQRIASAVKTSSRPNEKSLKEKGLRGKNLPVYIVDYVPPENWQLAIDTAQQITKLGFTPWVTTADLHGLGINEKTPVPRRLLAYYNSEHSSLGDSILHHKIASIAEYLGYRLDYVDISQPFITPPDFLYQGAILWPEQVTERVRGHIYSALDYFTDIKLPFLLLGDAYINDPTLSQKLGFKTTDITGNTRVADHHSIIGEFEAPLKSQRPDRSLPIITNDSLKAWVTLTDENGNQFSPAFRGDWGALISDPYLLDEGYQNRLRWLVNPYELLTKGLKLPAIPIADITSENGRRLLISHIDGDGWVNKGFFPNTPYASEVIRDQILKRYPFYTTVSVIEAETSPAGVYPQSSKHAEDIAKSIFALNHIEAASHTYSHPFAWQLFDKQASKSKLIYGEHLPVPGYKEPSLEREIIGSVAYINQQLLADTDKQVEVFLWSGNAMPTEKAIHIIEQQGLLNMNGGDTVIRDSEPSLTSMTGIGRPLKSGWHIYAPIMNENVYTNNWTGPFHGFRHVIETFKRTDHPHRLKPLNIYYHFYSGDNPASLQALQVVYDWVAEQDPVSIYASEYIRRAKAFYNSAFTRDHQGNWHIVSEGPLRSLRLPKSLGKVNTRASDGIAGKKTINQQYDWLHLNKTPAVIRTNNSRAQENYLLESNGIILKWHREGNVFDLSMRSAQPLLIAFKGNCHLQGEQPKGEKQLPVTRNVEAGISRFQFSGNQVEGRFKCD